MKQKFYSMYGTAIDRYGDEHIVTIVGEFVQEKFKFQQFIVVKYQQMVYNNLVNVLTDGAAMI